MVMKVLKIKGDRNAFCFDEPLFHAMVTRTGAFAMRKENASVFRLDGFVCVKGFIANAQFLFVIVHCINE